MIISFVVLEKGRQITHGVDAMRQSGAVDASDKTNHPPVQTLQSASNSTSPPTNFADHKISAGEVQGTV